MNATEIYKLLEAKKNKSAEKGMQLARIEAEKEEMYLKLLVGTWLLIAFVALVFFMRM